MGQAKTDQKPSPEFHMCTASRGRFEGRFILQNMVENHPGNTGSYF